MNVLLTGAAGFIGSHLAERLISNGCAVVGVDNLSTGSTKNLAPVLNRAGFHFLEADLTCDGESITRFCDSLGFRPQRILHFASPASPVDYANLPLETLAVNSRGTEFCAAAALRWGASLLFASTSETYGDPLEHPQTETYWGNVNSVGPRSCYDEAKRFGEALVMAYVRSAGLDGRIVRLFNTYGPRMRANDGRVVPNFIMQALEGKALTVYGDGSQTRSFCFVDDVVSGILRFVDLDHAPGLLLNMGNPTEMSILAFARVVCDLAGVDLQICQAALPVDDPTRRCPDITKAKQCLGWVPTTDVREGLRRTIASFSAPGQIPAGACCTIG